jgi:hypothetical protein
MNSFSTQAQLLLKKKQLEEIGPEALCEGKALQALDLKGPQNQRRLENSSDI